MIGYYYSDMLAYSLKAAADIESVGGEVINFTSTSPLMHYVYFRFPSEKVRANIESCIGFFNCYRGANEPYRES